MKTHILTHNSQIDNHTKNRTDHKAIKQSKAMKNYRILLLCTILSLFIQLANSGGGECGCPLSEYQGDPSYFNDDGTCKYCGKCVTTDGDNTCTCGSVMECIPTILIILIVIAAILFVVCVGCFCVCLSRMRQLRDQEIEHVNQELYEHQIPAQIQPPYESEAGAFIPIEDNRGNVYLYE